MMPAMMLGDVAYRPFLDPLKIWVWAWFWPLLMLPLCLGLAVVYKSIRCRTMRRVPRETAELFILIVVGMILAAAALSGLAHWMD